jgi:tryptophan halogenase
MIAAAASLSCRSNMRGKFRVTFPLRSIAIVGTGVSGWLAAATLRRVLGESCGVTALAMPDDSAISGALPAVPSLHRLLDLLGADEHALMRATQATYRLGTQFRDWGAPGERYFQGFGSIGAKLDAVPFHHQWLRLAGADDCAALEEFSMAAQLARLDRFAPPHNDPRTVLSLYSYAWHFDAKLLAGVFRQQALRLGAAEVRDELADVECDARGDIRALRLASGARIESDFFIDCSGARGALASPLGVEFEDWSEWLPCDRTQSVRIGTAGALPPYAEFQARPHGWRFSLPLQRDTIRGYVYASEFAGDDAIAMELADWAGTARTATAPSGLLRGRPREFWVRNCVLMPGDALDPLETTALHLAQSGITRLLAHFPVRADSPTDRGEYNRLTCEEYDHIRDLLVLHYHASARDDSPLWQRSRTMKPPDSLAQRLALFADSARLTIGEDEHCGRDGWLAVLLGQGVRPRSYDPLADVTPAAGARDALAKMAAEMRSRAACVPLHRDFLQRNGLMLPADARSMA